MLPVAMAFFWADELFIHRPDNVKRDMGEIVMVKLPNEGSPFGNRVIAEERKSVAKVTVENRFVVSGYSLGLVERIGQPFM